MLLLNRTLLKMAKGLWGWMGVIVGLKMVTLVGTTMFAKTISQFLGNLYAPNLTWAEAGSAILAALLAAILMFASELLTGEAEYRCTAKARTSLRRRIFAKVMVCLIAYGGYAQRIFARRLVLELELTFFIGHCSQADYAAHEVRSG